MKKYGLTKTEHEIVGKYLKEIDIILGKICCKLSEAYSVKIGDKLLRIIRRLAEIRSNLENKMFLEDKNASTKIYFGKTEQSFEVMSIIELLESDTARLDFGHWQHDKKNNVLRFKKNGYEIDLDDMTCAQMLDWIFQIHSKTWGGIITIHTLLNAFTEIFDPQATMCSFGRENKQ